jgi:hypothetical protein
VSKGGEHGRGEMSRGEEEVSRGGEEVSMGKSEQERRAWEGRK